MMNPGDKCSQPEKEEKTARTESTGRSVDTDVLMELERLRIELLANISHELRTPLTSIKGFTSTLLQPDIKWTDEQRRDFLKALDQETDQLNLIITGLLDASRLDGGGIILERGTYYISDILDSISNKLSATTKHHPLSIKVPPKLPPVYVDQRKIGQVIISLVQNATKYSRCGSAITIEVKDSSDTIIVSVTDRGVGIPLQLLDKAFDRYYQIENIVTGKPGNNSLSLTICRNIIENHGCKIWVESRIGDGSRFSFTLPVSKIEENKAKKPCS